MACAMINVICSSCISQGDNVFVMYTKKRQNICHKQQEKTTNLSSTLLRDTPRLSCTHEKTTRVPKKEHNTFVNIPHSHTLRSTSAFTIEVRVGSYRYSSSLGSHTRNTELLSMWTHRLSWDLTHYKSAKITHSKCFSHRSHWHLPCMSASVTHSGSLAFFDDFHNTLTNLVRLKPPAQDCFLSSFVLN